MATSTVGTSPKSPSPLENMARWFAHSIIIQDRFVVSPIFKGNLHRGDIYACYLGQNIGYEKSRLEARPCVIVSSDQINKSGGNIVVVPLSKNIKYESGSTTKLKYAWHFVLLKSKYKLRYDSAAQCEDIRCVSSARLGKYIDHVEPVDMKNISKRIKSALQT